MTQFTRASVAVATMVAVGATGATFITQTTLASPASAQERQEYRVSGGPERRSDRRGGGRRGMMRDFFRQADANGDRAITQEEVDAFIAAKVELGDGDGDGSLTLEEFRVVFMDLANRRIVDAFQRQDEDGDGLITPVELDERFGDIVERMDRNDDGVLDRSDRRGWRERRDRG